MSILTPSAVSVAWEAENADEYQVEYQCFPPALFESLRDPRPAPVVDEHFLVQKPEGGGPTPTSTTLSPLKGARCQVCWASQRCYIK